MNSARKTWRTYLLAALAASFLLSCTPFRPLPPEVSLTGLDIGGLTLSHADLNARLRVFNPNRLAVTIEQVDYTLLLDGIKISDGRSAMPIRIGAQQYGDLDMKLSASYLSLWQVVTGITSEEEVKFSLEGSVQIGGLRILNKTFPIHRQGTISLKELTLR
jgi:LEA14-like dessication related protein